MQLIAAIFGGGGLVLGGFLAYFVTDYFADLRVDAAVEKEAARQVELCNGKIVELQADINVHALETVSAGNAAVISLEPTPEDLPALELLCAKETACRDR